MTIEDDQKLRDFLINSIRVLAEYQLIHVPVLISDNGKDLEGFCIPEKKIILINDEKIMRNREIAVIHELLHANDLLYKNKSYEREVEKRADELNSLLYGK